MRLSTIWPRSKTWLPSAARSSRVALMAAVTLAACQAKPPAPAGQAVLRIASQKGGTKSLMLAAHALDGAPYKVEWSEFPSAQTLLEALGAGAVDAGGVGDAPFLFAYSAGSKIKVVQASRAADGSEATAVLVRADSPIHTPADLRGKSIATGKGSIGHYLLLRVLEKAGLTPKDVKLVFLSPGDARSAFDSGSVDAWATWVPYVGLAQLHDHTRILADGGGLLSGVAFMAASDSAIAGRRPELADFLKRLAKAYQWERGHEDAFAAVLAKETGLPADVALYTVKREGRVPVPIDASVLAEEHDTMDHFVKAGVIPAAPNMDGAFDASFNDAAKP